MNCALICGGTVAVVVVVTVVTLTGLLGLCVRYIVISWADTERAAAARNPQKIIFFIVFCF
jgi:hypothetical protein